MIFILMLFIQIISRIIFFNSFVLLNFHFGHKFVYNYLKLSYNPLPILICKLKHIWILQQTYVFVSLLNDFGSKKN